MHHVKLPDSRGWNSVALLSWALVLAFVLSLILFGVMVAAAYVADELCSPSLNEASYPLPQPDRR
jgi:hypothetical protein